MNTTKPRKFHRRPRRLVWLDGWRKGMLDAADEAMFQGGTPQDIARALREKATKKRKHATR